MPVLLDPRVFGTDEGTKGTKQPDGILLDPRVFGDISSIPKAREPQKKEVREKEPGYVESVAKGLGKGLYHAYADVLRNIGYLVPPLKSITEEGAKKYEAAAQSLELPETKSAAKNFINSLSQNAGYMLEKIPEALALGSTVKAATASTNIAKWIGDLSDFVVGSTTQGAVEGAREGGPTRAVTKAAEQAVLSKLYEGPSSAEALAKRALKPAWKKIAGDASRFTGIGVGQTIYEAAKQGRAPTEDELKQSIADSLGMYAAFQVIPIVSKLTGKGKEKIAIVRVRKAVDKAVKKGDVDAVKAALNEFMNDKNISDSTKEKVSVASEKAKQTVEFEPITPKEQQPRPDEQLQAIAERRGVDLGRWEAERAQEPAGWAKEGTVYPQRQTTKMKPVYEQPIKLQFMPRETIAKTEQEAEKVAKFGRLPRGAVINVPPAGPERKAPELITPKETFLDRAKRRVGGKPGIEERMLPAVPEEPTIWTPRTMGPREVIRFAEQEREAGPIYEGVTKPEVQEIPGKEREGVSAGRGVQGIRRGGQETDTVEEITTKSGKPFKTKGALVLQLRRRGLLDTHEPVQTKDGWIGKPKPTKQGQTEALKAFAEERGTPFVEGEDVAKESQKNKENVQPIEQPKAEIEKPESKQAEVEQPWEMTKEEIKTTNKEKKDTLKKAIVDAIEKAEDYEDVGIRVITDPTKIADKNKIKELGLKTPPEVKEGNILDEPSFVWDEETPTEELRNGVSVIGIDKDGNNIDKAIEQAKTYAGNGSQVVVLTGDRIGSGLDLYEDIFDNAKVKYVFPNNILETPSEIAHKIEVQTALREGKPVPRKVLEEYKGEEWADKALENIKEADLANKKVAQLKKTDRELRYKNLHDKLLSASKTEKDKIAEQFTEDLAKRFIKDLDAAPGDDLAAREAIYNRFPKLKSKVYPVSQSQDKERVKKEIKVKEKEAETLGTEKFAVPNEIDIELATSAHRGTSFSPEVRGKQEQQEYADHVNRVYKEIMSMARNEHERAIAREKLEKYKSGFKKRFEALLASKANTLSPMIVGPSKFPTKRNERALATEKNRLNELLDFDKKAIERMKRKLRPELSPISSTASDAVERLKAKIKEKEKRQELMKSANKIVKSKKLSNSERIEKLQNELGLSKKVAEKLLEPDYMGNIGFPSYGLRNNNAEIRRLKQRLSEIENRKKVAATVGGSQEVSFDKGKVEINYDDGYVRIYYDSKPDQEVRTELKRNGFRWAPSEQAWRRKLTSDAKWKTEKITGIKWPKVKPKDTKQYSLGERPEKPLAKPLVDLMVKKASAKWKDAPGITVVEKQSDLPKEVQRPEPIKGVYYKDNVYLVSENLTSHKDVVKTLAEEVIGHAGLRKALYSKLYDQTLDTLWNKHKNDISPIARDYKLDVTKPEQRRQAVDEWVSKQIANDSLPKRIWQRIVFAVKAFARKLGYSGNLTLNEIKGMLRAGVNRKYGLPAEGEKRFALGKAADTEQLKEAAEAIKETEKEPEAPESIKPFLKKVKDSKAKEFLSKSKNAMLEAFAPSLLHEKGEEAEAKAGALIAKQMHTEDVIKKALYERKRWWDKLPKTARIKYIISTEEADNKGLLELAGGNKKIYKTLQAIRSEHRDIFNRIYEAEKKAGIELGYIKDYWVHLWKDPDKAAKVFKQFKESMGKDSFTKTRVLDTIKQGLELGLELKTTNPEEMVIARVNSGVRAITRQKFMDWLVENGLSEPYKKGVDTVDKRIIDAPNGKSYAVVKEIVPLIENAGFLIDGPKSLWVKDTPSGMAYRALMRSKNMFIPIKLGMSLFHATHIGTIMMPAVRTGIILDALEGGKSWGEAIKDLAKVSTGLTHIKEVKEGLRLGKLLDKPLSELSPADRQTVQYILEGGFTTQMPHEWKVGAKEAFEKALDEKNVIKIFGHGTRRLVELSGSWLFEYYVPALKRVAYLKRVRDLIARRPDLADDANERLKEFAKIRKSVDNQFGEMTYKTLFWKPILKDVGIGSMLSMGWQLGFAREYGGAIGDTAKFIKAIIKKEGKPKITGRMLFVADYTIQSLLLGGLLTWALTGSLPNKLIDYLYPRTGDKDPDGTETRLNTPYYTREFGAIAKHISTEGPIAGMWHMFKNKANPIIAPILRIWTNKDFYGADIRDPHAPILTQTKQFLEYLAGEIAPISILSAKKGAETMGWAKSILLSEIGFTKAPKYIQLSPIQSEIFKEYSEYKDKHMTRGEAERSRIKHKMRVEWLTTGKISKETWKEAFKKDVFTALTPKRTRGNIKRFIRSLRLSSDIKAFAGLPTDIQVYLLKKMNQQELKKFLPHAKGLARLRFYRNRKGSKK